MYNQTNNRRCVKGRYNQYQQCSNLVNKVIPSCSNVYGMDGWPASTPQQSNVGYTNGISGFSPPNGFKQYLQPMYLYKYNTGYVNTVNNNIFIHIVAYIHSCTYSNNNIAAGTNTILIIQNNTNVINNSIDVIDTNVQ